MHALKRLLDRSLVAQAVLLFVLGVGIAAVFRRDGSPLRWVVQGALYAAVAVVIGIVQHRRAGRAEGTDPRRLTELNRRVRHRDVPQDPEERAVMRRLVAANLRQTERAARWLPYWLGAMGLLTAALLVLGVVTGSYTFPVVFTVAVIGLCFAALRARRRSLDDCHYMRAALDDPNPGERAPVS
ncbi:hypothetical protein ABZ858_14370 [Streptomyces sp. NPDC047017]|uniref:hypothetical protein n=1 Tax=Streptomyces sp. NPDC047017 TaxID=3155024 RepID=UPI0033FA32DB